MKKRNIIILAILSAVIAAVYLVSAGISPSLDLNGYNIFGITNYTFITGVGNISVGSGTEFLDIYSNGTTVIVDSQGYNISYTDGVHWDQLTEYPVACPSGYYVTEIGDSTTCTALTNVYGGMWYHNHTATTLNFAVDGTFYYLFMGNASHLNGFTSNNLGLGLNSSLTVSSGSDGIYKASYMSSGSGENNEVYYTSIFINEDNQDNCESHHKMSAGGDIITQSGTCIIDLIAGQNVSIRTANVGDTGSGNYYSSNLNLVRIA